MVVRSSGASRGWPSTPRGFLVVADGDSLFYPLKGPYAPGWGLGNEVIRTVDPRGVVTTLAGNGLYGQVDGPERQRRDLRAPRSVWRGG